MTSERFDAILEERIGKMRSVLASKAKEYASPQDVLHLFKRMAELAGTAPAEACITLLSKHLVSVFDVARGDLHVALLDEKIGDAVNYLVLLEAILRE
jgi:hypothetical protein